MTASTESADGPARRVADRVAHHLSHTYQDALAVADAAGAERVARQALGEGMTVAALYQRVIAPAMWRVGELWERGTISVADEHLATALTQQVMAGIYGPSLGHEVTPGRILLAAVEGEQHALGLRMAADVIELAGYETIYLGADVPTDDLLGAVAVRAPDLLVLAATMPDSTPALDRTISGVKRVDPRLIVLLGGRGAQPRPEEGARFVPNLEQLLPAVRDAFGARISDAGGAKSIARTPPGQATETADLARSLARQANTFKDLAYTDVLCGLPNRRAFEDRAVRLRDFADAKPLAVLLMDLDRFKPVNDTHGHEAGDRVLALMARTIAGRLREGDFVARLGGDEFAALLPRTGMDQAAILAERLRASVEDAGSKDSVTTSIGIAMLEEDVRRALLRADLALYEAKNAGRNTIRHG